MKEKFPRSETLPELRQEVMQVDEELFALVAQRLELAKRIGELKRLSRSPVTDDTQEQVVREYWQKLARQMDVSSEFADRLVSLLMDEAKRVQGEG